MDASNQMAGKRVPIFFNRAKLRQTAHNRETTFRSAEAGQNIYLNAGQGPRGQLVRSKDESK